MEVNEMFFIIGGEAFNSQLLVKTAEVVDMEEVK